MARTHTTAYATLFGDTATPEAVHARYIALAKLCHAHHGQYGVDAVLSRLNQLYDAAEHALQTNTYGKVERFAEMVPDGAKHTRIWFEADRARSHTAVPTGYHLLGPGVAVDVLETPAAVEALASGYIGTRGSLALDAHSFDVRETMKPRLPLEMCVHHGAAVVPPVVSRAEPWRRMAVIHMKLPAAPDAVRLSDLLQQRTLDQREVAWVGSELWHLACWLEYAGLVHNDISPTNLMISCQLHTLTLFGGWWFAHEVGKTLALYPESTTRYAVPCKVADHAVDRACIRGILTTLLTGSGGDRVDAIVAHLRSAPALPTAVAEARVWREALRVAFDAPKFFKTEVGFASPYGPVRACNALRSEKGR